MSEDTPILENQEELAPALTIGQQLKQARAAKGLELAEVANQTKIKKTFLEFLENDEFQKMPNLMTAKGFLKVYAGLLGLNIDAVSKQFVTLFPGEAGHFSGREVRVGLTVDKRTLFPHGMKSMNAPGISRFRTSTKNKKGGRLLLRLLGGLIIIFALLALSTLYFRNTMDGLKNNQLRQKADMEKLVAKDTPESRRQQAYNPNKIYIEAQALNKTYVSVVIDGRTIYQGNMERGDAKIWDGNQYIRIRASVPRNLYLFINGKESGAMDNQSAEIEKTYYTPSTLQTDIEKTERKADTTQPAPAQNNI